MQSLINITKSVAAKLDGLKTYLAGYATIITGLCSMFGLFSPADATEAVKQVSDLISQLGGISITLGGIIAICMRHGLKKKTGE